MTPYTWIAYLVRSVASHLVVSFQHPWGRAEHWSAPLARERRWCRMIDARGVLTFLPRPPPDSTDRLLEASKPTTAATVEAHAYPNASATAPIRALLSLSDHRRGRQAPDQALRRPPSLVTAHAPFGSLDRRASLVLVHE